MIKKLMKDTGVLIRAFILPLAIFIISLAIFCVNKYFLNETEFLKEISLAFLSGSLFYWLTVSLPTYRHAEIAKKYVLKEYCTIKKSMLRDFLVFSGKKVKCQQEINDAVRNYLIISHLFTEDYEGIIRGKVGEKNFVSEMLYSVRSIKDLLLPLLTYDFVRGNKKLFVRINNLNAAIDDLYNAFSLWYTEKDEYDFSKDFVNFMGDFLFGISQAIGPRETDDLIELLEKA